MEFPSSSFADQFSFSDLLSSQATPVYGISDTSAWADRDQPYNFWAFISLCQAREVDFFPITWSAGLGETGRGGQGSVYQSDLTSSLGLVFKRWKWAATGGSTLRFPIDDEALEKMYRGLMAEILILTEPAIRECPYIIAVEGVCWERIRLTDFTPVLVFERASFGDLAGYVSNYGNKLSLIDRLRLCAQIARGLLVLHRNRTIHGDLSPDNVLVFKDHESEGTLIPRLTDFGCATLITDEEPYVTPASKEPWRAPELSHREVSFDAAVKAEIFSLGMLCVWVVFYEKLIEDDGTDSMDIDEPGSPGGAHDTTPYFTRTLERLLALKKYNLLKEAAINVVQSDSSLPANLADLLVCLFDRSLDTDPSKREDSVDDLFTILDLSTSMPTVYNPWRPPKPFSVADHPVFDNPTIGRHHPVRGWALEARSRVYSARGKWNEAERCLRRSIRIQTRFFGPLHPHTLKSRYYLGEVLKQQHKLPLLESLSRNTWRAAQNVNGRDHPHTLAYLMQHLECIHFLGRLDETETRVSGLLEMAVPVLGEKHPVVTNAKYLLGLNYYEQEEWDKALVLLEENFDHSLVNDSGPIQDPDTKSMMQNLALLYVKVGRIYDGQQLLERVMDSLQSTSSMKESPESLLATVNCAAGLHNTSEFDRAQTLEELCLARCMRQLGPGNWITILCMGNLANTYAASENSDRAELLYRLALENSCVLNGRRSPDAVARLSELASYLSDRDQHEQAVEMQTLCCAEAKENLGAEHPETIAALRCLAEIRFTAGHFEESLKIYEEALSVQLAVHGAGNPQTIIDEVSIGLIQTRMGLREAAEEIQRRAVTKIADLEKNSRVHCLKELLENVTTYSKGRISSDTCVFFNGLLDQLRDVAGGDSEEVLQSTKGLAGMYFHGQQPYMAIRLQIEVVKAILPQLHKDSEHEDGSEGVSVLAALAVSLCAVKCHEQAKGAATTALNWALSRFPDDEEEILFIAQVIAFCGASAGDWDSAESAASMYLARFGKTKALMSKGVKRLGSEYKYDREAVMQIALYASPHSIWDKVFRLAGLSKAWSRVKLNEDRTKLRDWVLRMRRMGIHIV
ncbi:hypothetical protein G7Z17_g4180 [Cylindrodendrum hubeiense]|uniref:Protein kinase domain-containing protein n=1 Tax=Cylindrodendrum hubeiense TaxID=595255 RepID=A0A9P5LHF6_9HYPO|nr:hypothetical protein G7Z17_g4180 [Cylindrodendrum hubeiense]